LKHAFAKAGIRNDELMEGLAKHGISLLRDGIDQCCYRGPMKSLFKEMYVGDGSAVDGKVDAFDCLILADMLWAFAELQVPAREMELLAEEYLMMGLDRKNAQTSKRVIRYTSALAKVLIAFAALPGDHTSLFELAEPHILKGIRELPMWLVAKLTWAWAVVGVIDDFLIDALDNRLTKLLEWGKGQALEPVEVRNLQWACEELGIGDEAMRAKLSALPSS